MSIQESIEQRLTSSFSPTHIEVIDVSNCSCGYMFNVVIVSEAFTNRKILERQRLVNESIGEIYDKIHSVSMKCYTPSEYEVQKS